jgi:uncharacterized protein (TIGR00255 family)
MIRSMTGYGSAELERDGQRLVAEIRSVNHRYCEVSVRAPKLVSLYEDQLRLLIQETLSRGKITLSLTWAGVGESGEVLKLNVPVAERYVALIAELKQRFHLEGGLDVRTVSGLPDVFTWEHTVYSDEETWKILSEVTSRAMESLNRMKEREGAALKADLHTRLDLVGGALDKVVQRAPLRPAEMKERLSMRLKPLLGDLDVDPVRLAQEMALFADRVDCTEECVRLHAHLDQFRALMEGNELAGRKLNFLLQEMNREANTIGSKANDVEIAHAVVTIKEELERLREQVQNVE